MIPPVAQDLILLYAAISILAVLLFLRRRPVKGIRLRLGQVNRPIERPLNVVFNYNGHSWDAFEVLGVPAGSSYEKVIEAYHAALNSVDATSRPFIHAAFQAIEMHVEAFKAAK